MLLFLYNLFLPVGFLFFLPGIIYKYRHRGGWKETFGERFGKFSDRRKQELQAFHGAIWVHAVSVGETIVALSMIRAYLAKYPERKFILSTTTTTGQELARSRTPANTAVIFCPIDFRRMVRDTFDVLHPGALVIFETELWPNMIEEAHRRNIPLALVNGRMSDHSARGYRKAKVFFAPMLEKFNVLLVQSEADAERYRSVSPRANVVVTGNLKFDQQPPSGQSAIDLAPYFGDARRLVLLAASTHPGEEELIADTFAQLRRDLPELVLVLIPRHAERGAEIAAILEKRQLSFVRRSLAGSAPAPVQVLLADTTGEMMRFMQSADLVIMGKSLAGHDEGHNLIEPALLGKAIVTGAVLRNFRYILKALESENAVVTVTRDSELETTLSALLISPERRAELGRRAAEVIARNRGAADRSIEALEALLRQ